MNGRRRIVAGFLAATLILWPALATVCQLDCSGGIGVPSSSGHDHGQAEHRPDHADHASGSNGLASGDTSYLTASTATCDHLGSGSPALIATALKLLVGAVSSLPPGVFAAGAADRVGRLVASTLRSPPGARLVSLRI